MQIRALEDKLVIDSKIQDRRKQSEIDSSNALGFLVVVT